MPEDPDASLPYMEIDGEVQAVPYRNIDPVGPAGSINSSVEEMLHYIQMNIDQGTFRGTQVISEQMAGEMQRPQFVSSTSDPEFPELGYGSYGLGLTVSTYRGHKLVAHGGGIDGFISSMSWMPHQKIGVMVLTNFSGVNPVPTLVRNRVYDELLGLDPVDWVGRTREDLAEARERQEEQQREKEESRAVGTSPSHALADYAGTYLHPGYGAMEVRVNGDGLGVTFDQFEFRLNHFHYDVFEVEAGPGVPVDDLMVVFLYDKKGVVDRLLAPLEPTVADIVFQKVVQEEGERR
jgi:CubicO group peptidase (beta-lactamase class C family)